jgi:hypothetical protein
LLLLLLLLLPDGVLDIMRRPTIATAAVASLQQAR